MKIITRIRWSALLAVVIAASVAAVLLIGMNRVAAAIERNDRAAQSLNSIFELSMLTTDYLVHYEPRAERQWRAKHAELGVTLQNLSVSSAEDQAMLARISANEAEAYRLFDEITVVYEQGEAGILDQQIAREYQARLTARLLIVMQSMVSDSVTLGNRSSVDALATQQRTYVLVLVIALASIGLMVVIGLSTNKTIVRPLLVLRESAMRIGQGDLDVRSGIDNADEVGELARAFDGMVIDLQQSYALLQQEIADRRHAEAELSEYRAHLEQLVEARTAELVALNEDLRRATRAKDDFMASMSHELRTPLNSIIGFTDLMLRGMAGELTQEQRRQLTMVLHSGQQLLALIDELLDLALLEAGQSRIMISEIPIEEAIGTIVEMMVPIAEGQRLTLQWHMEEGVPTTMRSDRAKVDQIMLNLLSNAVKYTNEGGIEVVVRPLPGGGVAVDVHDTGIGIPRDEIDVIFQHFQRGSLTEAPSHPGTGLGLAISRRLADVIGATVSVVSEPGRGSTFTLTLPVRPPGLLVREDGAL
jgi:signal transduction histidine kinase